MTKPLRLGLLAALIPLLGCTGAIRWVGVRLFYEQAAVAAERMELDVPYVEGSTSAEQRLDLIVPDGSGWPVVVFVHGGGWTAGDKGLVVAGADVYRNVGRFLASQGIGAAIVNYRLQPSATWREQVADVARALAWVRDHVAERGGDRDRLFLAGHSAGAQLAAYVALAPAPLAELGLTSDAICGVVAVSGAGFDLADAETYELGADRAYYEARFRAGDPGDGWLREASATSTIVATAPPFLVMHGSLEAKGLEHQNRLLDRALRDAGAASRLLVAKGQTHEKMVLALSRGDGVPGAALLDFVRTSRCGRGEETRRPLGREPASIDANRCASSRTGSVATSSGCCSGSSA